MVSSMQWGSTMSGWQRIGVVISALWLIGFPIYLVQYSSMSERSLYQQCMNTHNPDLTREEQHNNCRKSSRADALTLKDIADTLFTGNFDIALWSMMLVPVAVFWLVGSIALVTARWIRRGLARFVR